ncbi:hypothetical protein C8R46DRAFT_1219754 [Mycena filopes]|nr:hypothetical protein C8R46DRAFT_1219754 [Mycena filopes]
MPSIIEVYLPLSESVSVGAIVEIGTLREMELGVQVHSSFQELSSNWPGCSRNKLTFRGTSGKPTSLCGFDPGRTIEVIWLEAHPYRLVTPRTTDSASLIDLHNLWTPFNLTCLRNGHQRRIPLVSRDALDALPSILARTIVKFDSVLEIDQGGSNEL